MKTRRRFYSIWISILLPSLFGNDFFCFYLAEEPTNRGWPSIYNAFAIAISWYCNYELLTWRACTGGWPSSFIFGVNRAQTEGPGVCERTSVWPERNLIWKLLLLKLNMSEVDDFFLYFGFGWITRPSICLIWIRWTESAYGKFPFSFITFVFFVYSNVPSSNGFQQMARMMDSLILNEFPPYTFTKITATHRPTRTPNGLAAKLLTKSTAMSPTGGLAGVIRPTMQKPKVPLQGKWTRRQSFSERP